MKPFSTPAPAPKRRWRGETGLKALGWYRFASPAPSRAPSRRTLRADHQRFIACCATPSATSALTVRWEARRTAPAPAQEVSRIAKKCCLHSTPDRQAWRAQAVIADDGKAGCVRQAPQYRRRLLVAPRHNDRRESCDRGLAPAAGKSQHQPAVCCCPRRCEELFAP